MKPISRREFGTLVAAGLVTGRLPARLASAQAGIAAIPASEILDRIRRSIGVEWSADTVDTVKAGDQSTMITGVVTTAMATIEVLRQAVEQGANLIITSEPTFYGRADSRTPRAGPGGPPPAEPPPSPPPDPIYTAKNELIDGNGLIVFRLSDHWRARRPDPFAQGLAERLGLGESLSGEIPRHDIPQVTLEAFVRDVAQRLGTRGGIRVVGNPQTAVRRVALLPGTTPITASLAAMPDTDVVMAGEVREWESVEYARDLVYSGQAKALVLLGRVVSDDPGMAVCARWLETLVPEVPVRHVSAGDPYWRPEA